MKTVGAYYNDGASQYSILVTFNSKEGYYNVRTKINRREKAETFYPSIGGYLEVLDFFPNFASSLLPEAQRKEFISALQDHQVFDGIEFGRTRADRVSVNMFLEMFWKQWHSGKQLTTIN
jgi:hypothetical protein